MVSLKLVTKKQIREMKVESEPPHKLKVFLSQEDIQTSRQVYRTAYRRFLLIKTKLKMSVRI